MAGESELLEPLGKRIRYFFRDIFGSRVLEHLENEKMQLREDFEKRLQDKDNVIASLREEKALLMSKVAMYEITLLPHASRAGAEVVAYQKPLKPAFSFVDMPAPKSRWQQVQEDYEKQLEKESAEEVKAATAAAKE
jgi:hypothetical protein